MDIITMRQTISYKQNKSLFCDDRFYPQITYTILQTTTESDFSEIPGRPIKVLFSIFK